MTVRRVYSIFASVGSNSVSVWMSDRMCGDDIVYWCDSVFY